MNKYGMRIISLLMSAVIAVLMVPVITRNDVLAATKKAYSGDPIAYTITETYNEGWYIEPDAPGKYPAVIFVHGSGGPEPIRKNIVNCMNKWVTLGYIDPMVVFVPYVHQIKDEQWGIPDFGEFTSKGYSKELADEIMSGKISSKVDTKSKLSLCGYSMGGSVTLHSGVLYPETFTNLGAFSPSWCFYAGESGYIKDSSKIEFSKDADAHFFMGYGEGEKNDSGGNDFKSNVNRYKDIFNTNGKNPKDLFKIYAVPEEVGGHKWVTFKREFFNFLYYLKHNKLASSAVIEAACGNGAVPVTDKWVKEDGKWYYYDSDGVKTTGLAEIKGKLYYFNSKGVMKTGMRQVGKYYYYFCSDGNAVKGWKKLDGKWYYFAKKNYHRVKGVKTLGGKIYLFYSDGVMKTKGWRKDSKGNWYYINAGGDATVSTTKVIGGKKYKFNKYGICTNRK